MKTDEAIIQQVAYAFAGVERPRQFCVRNLGEESLVHEQLLQQHDRDSLRVHHVDTPWSDPIAFCSPQAKAYFLPTLVRFALAGGHRQLGYGAQLLYHLEGDGPGHALIAYCTRQQRAAVATFLTHLIDTRPGYIQSSGCVDEILRTQGYWADAALSGWQASAAG